MSFDSIDKWQYARYVSEVGGQLLPDRFSFYTPYGTFFAEKMSDILSQIVGRHPDEDEAGFDLFLNALGSEGWEIVHVKDERDTETGIYEMNIYFKRRVR